MNALALVGQGNKKMKIVIPDKVSKTSAEMFEKAGYSVVQKPGIEIGECSELSRDADAVIVRSYKLHDLEIGTTLKAIGRAGAGVNNIPVDVCSGKGIVVFNTPGANANGVKELTLCGMLLSTRKIVQGINWVESIKDQGSEAPKLIEKNKSRFKGTEIKGKTLGVFGLGSIGILVANDASALGMKVSAYTRTFSDDKKKRLRPEVKHAESLDALLESSDFISINIALNDSTKGIFNSILFAKMKPGVKIMNFARDELVVTKDLFDAIDSGIVGTYVTDFPNGEMLGKEGCICIPHLGASSEEAEENCAVMVTNEIVDYLNNGNILNSVNFPGCSLVRSGKTRITVTAKNKKDTSENLKTALQNTFSNITGTANESRGDISYTIIDSDEEINEDKLEQLRNIKEVINVRLLG